MLLSRRRLCVLPSELPLLVGRGLLYRAHLVLVLHIAMMWDLLLPETLGIPVKYAVPLQHC